jgi:catechol 2,3-dioxygenase-like lactoylglutathione lyase family enzyme
MNMKNTNAYHLKIGVSDGKRSKKFYDELFQKLGWETVYEDEEAAGYSDGDFTLWVVPAKRPDVQHIFDSVGYHHFAIKVKAADTVDAIYEWCKEQNVKVTDPPAKYPDYSELYYAVFFLDPDGLQLEIVFNPFSN